VDFLPADFVEFFGGLLVDDFVAGGFGFVFFELFGDLQGAIGQVGVLLSAVVLDAVGVDFGQFFVLLDKGQLATFAPIDVLESLVHRLALDKGQLATFAPIDVLESLVDRLAADLSFH
jgi:hypothetical protein